MSHTSSAPRWQFWIDRGGTFTDIVARTPEGDRVILVADEGRNDPLITALSIEPGRETYSGSYP